MDKQTAITTDKKTPKGNQSPRYTPVLLPVMVIIFGTVTGLWLESQMTQQNQRQIHQALAQRMETISEQVVEKITLYQYGLRGLRSAIISRGEQWFNYDLMIRYTHSRDFAEEFPGARGFGFIRRISPTEKVSFLQRMRQERQRPFNIRQLHAHNDDLFVIQYIEPEQRNSQAVGLDIGSEQSRRHAALSAAKTNAVVLTAPITLVQAAQKNLHGFLLLLPVYQNLAPEEPAQRLQQLVGWTYAPLLVDEILDSIKIINQQLSITISDHSADNVDTVFFIRKGNGVDLTEYVNSKTVPLFGRHWQISLTATPSFVSALALPNPALVFQLTALVTGLIALIIFFIQHSLHRKKQLRRQQAEMAAIVANANEVIIGKDKNGMVTIWNDAAVQMFGYAESEAVGMTVMELIIPADKKDEENYIINQVAKDKKIRSLDTVRKTRKGILIPVSVNVTPVKDENNLIIGSAATIHDISHIKQAEQDLLRANEKLETQVESRTREIAKVSTLQRSILESAGYAIIATDIQGIITLFNPAAEKILGYQQDEVVNKHSPALFHDEDEINARAKALTIELDKTIEPGFEVFVAKARLGKVDNNEWSYIRKDGSVCQVNLSVSALNNDKGDLVGFLGIAIDLTRQKQLEFELDLAKLSTEQTSDMVFWLTLEAKIIKVNQAACSTLSYQGSVLLRKAIEQICPEYTLQEWQDHLQQLQKKRQLQLNTYFLNNDGEKIPVSLTSTLVNLSGQQFLYIVARDISEQIQREQELAIAMDDANAANQAKSAFLANMSHEIRTPMNAVIGLLQLLQQSELTEKQQEYILKARTASHSLLNLLNDILDFSKVEAGKLELEEHTFDLHRLMDEISSLVTINLAEKDIEVIYDIAPQNPLLVTGDSFRIKQVLINLTSNAIKFTEQGEVIVSIQIAQQTDDAIQLLFSVKDSGIGMSEDQMEQLFSSFNQAESSTTRRYGGTGLGLAICKRLVELMGGKISVESQPGQGSTFSFSVWLIADTTYPRPTNNNDNTSSVLIVDDNEHARSILAVMIGDLGWQVDSASSGFDAVKKVQDKQANQSFYDLIFMDWQMPGLDGWQTAEQIRAIQPESQVTLIVMVTAYSRDLLARKHIENSQLFNAFLEKPVTKNMLLDTIQDIFNGPPVSTPSFTNQHTPRLSGLNLLLVEDNPTNQLVASDLLTQEGANVIIAQGGTFALKELQKDTITFDLILMDLQMPDLDGYKTTQLIREMPQYKLLPIVAMTANAMQSDKDACFAVGMNDHIGKPFEIDHLVNIIKKYTSKRHSRSEGSSVINKTVLTEKTIAYCQQNNIDITSALDRLGQAVPLYLKIINSFLTDLKDYQQQLDAISANTEMKDIQRLFHTLKGSAATIGMKELADFATKMDQELKESNQTLNTENIDLFKRLADDTQQKIEQLTQQLTPEKMAIHSQVSDDTDLAGKLDQLISLLTESNMQAIDYFSDLQPYIDKLDTQTCAEIDKTLSLLDFAGAIELVKSFRSKLNGDEY